MEQQHIEKLLAMTQRSLNAADTLVERVAELEARVETLETAAGVHGAMLNKAGEALDSLAGAFQSASEAIVEVNGKLRDLNGNDATLRDELLRQRDRIAAMGGNIRRPASAPADVN